MGTIPAHENEFPSLLFAEGAAPATPAAGLVICYAKADGLLYCKDDAGVETAYAAASAALAAHLADTADAHDASAISVADAGAVFTGTDVEAVLAELQAAIAGGGIPVTIVDAKGDLIAGTAADTATRVAVGANATVLEADSTASAGVAWREFIGASYATNVAHSFTTGAALTIVDFEDVVFDPGSDVTTGASWAFTAPVAGIYRVSAMVQFAGSTAWASGERALFQVFKNGSAFRTLARPDYYITTGTPLATCQGTTLVQLAASDTIDLRLTQNSGSTIALSADVTSNYVDIERVR